MLAHLESAPRMSAVAALATKCRQQRSILAGFIRFHARWPNGVWDEDCPVQRCGYTIAQFIGGINLPGKKFDSTNADAAVSGVNTAPVPGGNGGWFESAQGEGVRGLSNNPNHGGVVGVNTAGGNGGFFESDQGEGVRGSSNNPNHGGVVGVNTGGGDAGYFTGTTGRGVAGFSDSWQGVYGHSKSQAGVVGESDTYDGVFGVSHTKDRAGVSGHNPGGLAGYFDGNIILTGHIEFTNAADCAEEFDMSDGSSAEPGTVMVLGDDSRLRDSAEPYDKRVAGIVSGAGGYLPGLVLDKKQFSGRATIALMGKVYCKVDADFHPIAVGDLLTTSPTAGHAMRALDERRSFGAIIGKALRSLPSGRSLIPVLVSLQ
jgi:hypothetical protein